MEKIITIVIVLVVVAGLGYWVYQSRLTPEEETKEQACIDSGGKISNSMCCKATGDFPNACLIGPCGCSLDNSHKVKICDCGEDKCFDGHKCAASKTGGEPEKISDFLKELKRETGIGFSEIKPVEFKWIVSVDPKIEDVTIEGKGFEVKRISETQRKKIEPFLKDEGFEMDLYNIADGTIAGLIGYKKDQIVCTVVAGFAGYKEATGQWIPPEPDKSDVDIECGKKK